MEKKDDITVFLVDVDNRMISAWEQKFFDERNVKIINMDVIVFPTMKSLDK